MRLSVGITHPVNDPDRNCQVETTEKLIHFVDLLALHVIRSSPGLRLSMTQMTDIPPRYTLATPPFQLSGARLHAHPQGRG